MSEAQLRNYRLFYLTFPSVENCYTLCSELNWSQIRLIMCLDSKGERDYYIGQSKFDRNRRFLEEKYGHALIEDKKKDDD